MRDLGCQQSQLLSPCPFRRLLPQDWGISRGPGSAPDRRPIVEYLTTAHPPDYLEPIGAHYVYAVDSDADGTAGQNTKTHPVDNWDRTLNPRGQGSSPWGRARKRSTTAPGRSAAPCRRSGPAFSSSRLSPATATKWSCAFRT
jgi:hypothetical protein